MERDVVRPGLGELLDVTIGLLDHQVDVDRATRVVDEVRDRGRHQRPDRDGRDEVTVHHVDVDEARAGGHHLLDLRAEPREVGGEDRRGDPLAREEVAAARRGGIGGGFQGQIRSSGASSGRSSGTSCPPCDSSG